MLTGFKLQMGGITISLMTTPSMKTIKTESKNPQTVPLIIAILHLIIPKTKA